MNSTEWSNRAIEWGSEAFDDAKELGNKAANGAVNLLSNDYYSLFNITLAGASVAYDTMELFITSTITPAPFILATAVGFVAGIVFQIFVSDGKISGPEKNFYSNAVSLIAGPLPTGIGLISSAVQRLIFRTGIAGFRLGFMTSNLLLHTFYVIDVLRKQEERPA